MTERHIPGKTPRAYIGGQEVPVPDMVVAEKFVVYARDVTNPRNGQIRKELRVESGPAVAAMPLWLPDRIPYATMAEFPNPRRYHAKALVIEQWRNGYWERTFPGGFLKPEDKGNPKLRAVEELKEEAGVIGAELLEVARGRHSDPSILQGPYILYLALLIEQAPVEVLKERQSQEEQEHINILGWFTIEEIRSWDDGPHRITDARARDLLTEAEKVVRVRKRDYAKYIRQHREKVKTAEELKNRLKISSLTSPSPQTAQSPNSP